MFQGISNNGWEAGQKTKKILTSLTGNPRFGEMEQ